MADPITTRSRIEVTVDGDHVIVTSTDPDNDTRGVFTRTEWDNFFAEIADDGYWSHTVTDRGRATLFGPLKERPPA
jgi:hypothetical protein